MARSLKCIDDECPDCPGLSRGVLCDCSCHGGEDDIWDDRDEVSGYG